MEVTMSHELRVRVERLLENQLFADDQGGLKMPCLTVLFRLAHGKRRRSSRFSTTS